MRGFCVPDGLAGPRPLQQILEFNARENTGSPLLVAGFSPVQSISAVGATEVSPARKRWEEGGPKGVPFAVPFPRAFDLLWMKLRRNAL